MPNIQEDLQRIMRARYGEEVRGSIHDAISDINDVVDGNVSVVTDLTSRAEMAALNAETSASGVVTENLISEGWAKGTQNGVPVESGSPYYQNNSKYYSEQAASGGTVKSVNGKTGAVTLNASDVGALSTSDIEDSLTSTATNKALSANQGKALKNLIDGKTTTLIFANKTVSTSSWSADSTYSGFGFKASISCSGVASNDVPFVNFNVAEAVSGKYAPVALAGSNTVTIYASEKPSASITIPSIVVIKG